MFPNVWNYKRNSTNVRNQCLKLSQCLNLGAKLNPITASVVSWSALARTQLHCKVFKWYKWHIIQNTRWNSTESNHKVHASQILPEFMQAAQRDDHPLWSLAFKLRFESFLILFWNEMLESSKIFRKRHRGFLYYQKTTVSSFACWLEALKVELSCYHFHPQNGNFCS